MPITTITEVKSVAGLTNEYEDNEILSEIDIVEALLYQKYNLPKKSSFSIDNDYTDFFIHPDKVYEIIRLQASVATDVDPSGYLQVDEGTTTWSHSPIDNYVSLGSDFINTYENKIIRVQYIPKIYNELAKNIAALNLIDTTTIVDGQEIISPQITRIKDRIQRYKDMLKPKRIFYSNQEEDFDKYEYVSYNQTDLR